MPEQKVNPYTGADSLIAINLGEVWQEGFQAGTEAVKELVEMVLQADVVMADSYTIAAKWQSIVAAAKALKEGK